MSKMWMPRWSVPWNAGPSWWFRSRPTSGVTESAGFRTPLGTCGRSQRASKRQPRTSGADGGRTLCRQSADWTSRTRESYETHHLRSCFHRPDHRAAFAHFRPGASGNLVRAPESHTQTARPNGGGWEPSRRAYTDRPQRQDRALEDLRISVPRAAASGPQAHDLQDLVDDQDCYQRRGDDVDRTGEDVTLCPRVEVHSRTAGADGFER